MPVRALVKSIIAPLVLGLIACGGSTGSLERLDERAGLVVLRAREPLVFARTEPRYSRSTRDYLYLGPVETNRQGLREYFLWIGVATTLDRGFMAPAAEVPRMLYVTVNGEPVELPLAPWHDVVRTQSVEPVYETAVPVHTELAARMTLQQLTLLDREALQTAVVAAATGGPERLYRRWESNASFAEFLADVSAR